VHSLPFVATFVGRRDDVSAVRGLYAAGERLVTLTGTAGIGKTRLAREIAALAASDGDDAFECALEEARNIDDVAAAVARAVGQPVHAETARAFESIAERLAARGRSVLLFLDGFEHIVDVAETVIAPLLSHAPSLRVLVASRERLRLAQERVHEVPPLALEPAVALLTEHIVRARRRGPAHDSERPILERIARELDGLPLALELAGVRIAVLGARNVLERLDRRLDVLTRGTRTLRSSLDASWDLLSTSEQRVFADASVFRGGFTLDAILDVSGEEALDAVQALCEKSLLVARHDLEGEARFSQYLTIREYAAEKLEPTRRDEVLRRHAEHYAGLVEPPSVERENLFAVAERAFAGDDIVTATRALVALASVVLADGPIEPYLALLDRALESALDDRARVALLSARGRSRRRRGRVEDAAADQREAIELARRTGDLALEGQLVGEHGMTAYARCDFDEALRLFTEALDLQMAAGAVAEQAITLTKLGMVHRERGEIEDARAAARRALPLHRAANEAVHAAATLAELALCDLETGDLAAARGGLVAALELVEPTGNRVTEAFIRGFLAVVAHADGDLLSAEEGYRAALRVSRDVGYSRFEGGALGYAALVALERGDHDRAADALVRARELLAQSGDLRHYALFSGWLAACARARGDAVLAKTALDDARRAVPETDPMRTAVELTVALGDDQHPLPACVREHAERSWDVRLALARVETKRALRPATIPSDLAVRAPIVIEENGAWIERAAGRRVRCDNRLATQRILGALARARVETPGRGLTAAELVMAGWPGERILPAAAKNRLRVAVAWLRKHALGDSLVSVGDGYTLDARIVAVAPADVAREASTEISVQRSEVRALHPDHLQRSS
jgi:predicted ATPase